MGWFWAEIAVVGTSTNEVGSKDEFLGTLREKNGVQQAKKEGAASDNLAGRWSSGKWISRSRGWRKCSKRDV